MKQYDYLVVGAGLYGAVFAGYDIQFTVKDGVLAVRDVVPEITGDVSP